VAIANSGPGTNGSQFFVVYKNSLPPPDYTPFGRIVAGINVIQAIAKAGTDSANAPGDGHPRQKVTLDAVHVLKI
jgi:peptidyl-prolyl cis-trans isomerase B (cyclophilin B)